MKKLTFFLFILPFIVACESETLTESRSGAGINITGQWSGSLDGVNFEPGEIFVVFEFRQRDLIAPDGPDASRVVITGIMSFTRRLFRDCVAGGTVDSEETTLVGGRLEMTVVSEAGVTFNFSGTVTENRITGRFLAQGTCTVEANEITVSDTGSFSVTR